MTNRLSAEGSARTPSSSLATRLTRVAHFAQRLSDRQAIGAVLVLLCCLYLPFLALMKLVGYSYLPGDCPYYRAAVVSLLEDHDLLIANNVAGDPLNGQLALGRDGLVPKHPILLPLLSLPFYLLFGDPGLLLFNVLGVLTLMGLVYWLNRLFSDVPIAATTTLLYGTLTLFPAYSYNYSPDVLSTILVVGGLYASFTGRLVTCGALLGLSIFAKLPNAVPVGLIVGYLAIRTLRRTRNSPAGGGSTLPNPLELRAFMAFVAAFLVALAPLALTNHHLFGSVFASGYERTVRAHPDGVVEIVKHTARFQQPLLLGTLRVLFDPRNGLLLTNPVIALAAIGAALLRRGNRLRPEHLLIAAICVAQILFFATYDAWRSSTYSNRFLMTPVALSSVFTGAFLAWARDRLARRAEA